MGYVGNLHEVTRATDRLVVGGTGLQTHMSATMLRLARWGGIFELTKSPPTATLMMMYRGERAKVFQIDSLPICLPVTWWNLVPSLYQVIVWSLKLLFLRSKSLWRKARVSPTSHISAAGVSGHLHPPGLHLVAVDRGASGKADGLVADASGVLVAVDDADAGAVTVHVLEDVNLAVERPLGAVGTV